MTGQVMRPAAPASSCGEGNAQQVRAAYIGYIAYFGTYEIVPPAPGSCITWRAR